MTGVCQLCGRDPYEYVDVGLAFPVRVAVNCCDGAIALAAAAREGGDVKQTPAESPQSGGEAVTPKRNGEAA